MMPLLFALWHALFFVPQYVPSGAVFPVSGGGNAAPVYSASASECFTSSGGSCTATITIASGHLIVAAVTLSYAPPGAISVTDSNSDSFSSCTIYNEPTSGRRAQIFYAIAGATVTTVTSTVASYSTGNNGNYVQDYTNPAGLATGTIIDQCIPGATNANTTSWTTGTSSATTNATDLCLGFFYSNAGTWTAGSGYTARFSGSTLKTFVEDKTTVATGTQIAAATENTASYGPGVGACFQ